MPPDLAQIVIVDDDQAVCGEFARQLGERGYRVRVPTAASQIFDWARQRGIDVILLGEQALGRRGVQLLGELRQTWPRDHLAIVFMGSAGDPAVEIAALEANANDFVAKPVALSVLVA